MNTGQPHKPSQTSAPRRPGSDRFRGQPHRHIAASNEGLIVGRPVRNAVLRLESILDRNSLVGPGQSRHRGGVRRRSQRRLPPGLPVAALDLNAADDEPRFPTHIDHIALWAEREDGGPGEAEPAGTPASVPAPSRYLYVWRSGASYRRLRCTLARQAGRRSSRTRPARQSPRARAPGLSWRNELKTRPATPGRAASVASVFTFRAHHWRATNRAVRLPRDRRRVDRAHVFLERWQAATGEIVLPVSGAAMHRPELVPHRRALRRVLIDDDVIDEAVADPLPPRQRRIAEWRAEHVTAYGADGKATTIARERLARLAQQRRQVAALPRRSRQASTPKSSRRMSRPCRERNAARTGSSKPNWSA